MCDYSLHSVRNRLAEEGEQLVVHRFPTGSLGLASPDELRTELSVPSGAPHRTWRELWIGLRAWLHDCIQEPTCAVCIPPGARLVLRDIPERFQRQLGVTAEEEVTFTQLSASENCYRDAVRFGMGAEVLLQRLDPGQRVDVLALAPAEEIPQRAWTMAGRR